MKPGDRVVIKDVGQRVFNGKHGTIKESMRPDYEWAVRVDGHCDYPGDHYGFNENELELET